MKSTVYKCTNGHLMVSPEPLAQCSHMVDGKPCTGTPEPTREPVVSIHGGFR